MNVSKLNGYLLYLFLAAQVCVSAQSVPTLRERAQPYLESAHEAGSSFVVVSSASGMPNVSPDSVVTAFGTDLAPRTESGTSPYPTSLGGIGLQVVDSAGVSRAVQLLYVSPTQINFLLPAATATGLANVNIINGTGVVPSSTVQIQNIAPALFTANQNGMGVVAATAYRTVIPTNIATSIPVFDCSQGPGSCVSVPIALGVDTPIFVTLYFTGIRGRSSDSAVTVTIGGQQMQIRSISKGDDTGTMAGVDQILIPIPLSLRQAGEVDVVVAVDGKTSNTGRINVQ